MAWSADARRMSAFALLLGALAAAPVWANAGTGPASARVAALVAERWGVDADIVVIEWQDPPLGDDGTFTLRGNGAGGGWVVEQRSGDATRIARVRSGTMSLLPVAARDLPRGVALTDADIAWDRRVVWGPPSRTVVDSPAGWSTRRTMVKGEALAAPAVAPPVWVRAGEPVRIVMQRGTLQIALDGTAAGTGAAGERVQVRASTGRRLTGIVTAPGVVRITLMEREP